jgi:polyhydroxyalkanoate synthase
LFQQLINEGNTLFAISWRNPEPAHRDWNFDTYAQGVIQAIEIMQQITGAPKVDLMGVCAGGLTSAVAAGVLNARGDDWINTLSLLINVLDSRPEDSDFGLFVSERSVRAQKQMVRMKGRYDEKNVFEMFARLRLEENIMAFFRSNYLLGQEPPVHPLLFWSIDYTRVPSGFFGELLDMSVENKLPKGELKVMGQRLDLSNIKYPVYLLAGSLDHITPWKACYRSTQLFGGEVRFVLSQQAHTQTISSRPNNPRLKYWLADELPSDPDAWAKSATEHAGLWIPDWIKWLSEREPLAAKPAPVAFGNDEFPEIDRAPGRYVLES